MRSTRPRTIAFSLLIPVLAWALWVAPWESMKHRHASRYRVTSGGTVVHWELHREPRLWFSGDTVHLATLSWYSPDGTSDSAELTAYIHAPSFSFRSYELRVSQDSRYEHSSLTDLTVEELRARARRASIRAHRDLRRAASRGEIPLPSWFPVNDEQFFE